MGQDVYENEMKIVNSVDYLRGLQGKESVLLNPSNLLSDTFKRRSVFEGDVNTLITPGMYYINGNTTNTPFGYSGLMIVFTFDNASVQMVFNVFSGIGKRRARLYNNGAWDIWSAWD